VADNIEIECLPTDIPNHILADISKLETVNDEVLARDLVLPESVRLVTEPEHVIFAVAISRAATEAEETAVEGEEETTEVEVIAKGKAAKAEEEF